MITLIVAVAAGFGVPAGHAGAHHGQAVASISTSVGNFSGCAQHDGCPIGQHASMFGSCFAACAGASMLPPAVAIFQFAATQGVLTPSLERAMVERTIPPDPRPPRQI